MMVVDVVVMVVMVLVVLPVNYRDSSPEERTPAYTSDSDF